MYSRASGVISVTIVICKSDCKLQWRYNIFILKFLFGVVVPATWLFCTKYPQSYLALCNSCNNTLFCQPTSGVPRTIKTNISTWYSFIVSASTTNFNHHFTNSLFQFLLSWSTLIGLAFCKSYLKSM